MSGVELAISGSADLTKLYSEAIALLSGRAFDRPGATQRRLKAFRDRVMARLQSVPPPRNRRVKFLWSHDPEKNANARRWFFHHFPNGYRRSGKLPKEWVFLYVIGAEGLTVVMRNEADAATWVYGDIDRPQVPGHETTGWLYAPDELLDAGAELERHVEREIDLILEAVI